MRDFSIDLIWAKIQVAITAVGGWIGWFLGGVDGMLIALIVLMALDYLSGVMCEAVQRHRLQRYLQKSADPDAGRCGQHH